MWHQEPSFKSSSRTGFPALVAALVKADSKRSRRTCGVASCKVSVHVVTGVLVKLVEIKELVFKS